MDEHHFIRIFTTCRFFLWSIYNLTKLLSFAMHKHPYCINLPPWNVCQMFKQFLIFWRIFRMHTNAIFSFEQTTFQILVSYIIVIFIIQLYILYSISFYFCNSRNAETFYFPFLLSHLNNILYIFLRFNRPPQYGGFLNLNRCKLITSICSKQKVVTRKTWNDNRYLCKTIFSINEKESFYIFTQLNRR